MGRGMMSEKASLTNGWKVQRKIGISFPFALRCPCAEESFNWQSYRNRSSLYFVPNVSRSLLMGSLYF